MHIEEIDLVSPPKSQTSQFINNERRSNFENGSGDHSRVDRKSKSRSPPRAAPAGYESDLSGEDSDLEME